MQRLVLLAACATSIVSAAERPNVLLIMTDDQGWGDIGSHDNEHIRTPVLDQLAAAGARFDRFFVSPVCAPTRASLLTGRYHLRTGTHGVTRGQENMRADEVTVAEAFKAAGYATGCFGKWHNGRHYPLHPNGQGFDDFVGFCAGHWNNYFNTELERNGQPFKSEGYIADALTDYALRFIDQHQDQPFFCYVPYNTPHSPWQVEDRYYQRYADKGLDEKAHCAYAMCENIDENVGRLLERLDQLKLTRNTIVLFLTDNGPNSNRFNGGMKGRKGSAHEGGVRVPLFIRWPDRIKRGTVVRENAMHIDLFPTLVELCGIDMPQTKPLDGRSLRPLLLGENTTAWPDRNLLTFRSRDGKVRIGAVRNRRWRAVRYQRWELYDMQADPGQQQDVAKQYPEIIRSMAREFEDRVAEIVGDGMKIEPIPVGSPRRSLTVLPGHEAFLMPQGRAGISYVGRNGWANDWVTNWTDSAAYPQWNLNVLTAGRYRLSIDYTCPKTRIGSTIEARIGSTKVDGTFDTVWDPDFLPSPDRIDRGEVYEKVWKTMSLGEVQLRAGPTSLTLHAKNIVGNRMPEIKAARLERINP